MDSLVDSLFSIKDSIEDAFLVLPHLLSGFFFLVGLFTTNIGMISMAIGHLLVVPALAFFSNNETFIQFNPLKIDIAQISFAILYAIIMICTVGGGMASSFGVGGFAELAALLFAAIFIGILFIGKGIFGFIGRDGSLFDTINPYVWFAGIAPKTKTSDICVILPGDKEGRRSPSAWIVHILFFFGFVIANAYSIYVLPTPKIRSTGDGTIDTSSQQQLNIRVNNRKIITGTIIGLSLVSLLVLLYVRLTLTPCEDNLYQSIIPMIMCFLIGISWFSFLTNSCGIPASDILGMVQGFITPDAIDNPIVCIGSANPISS